MHVVGSLLAFKSELCKSDRHMGRHILYQKQRRTWMRLQFKGYLMFI